MDRNSITIKTMGGLIVEPGNYENTHIASNFNLCLNKLGYIMSKELFEAVASIDEDTIRSLYNSSVQYITEAIGSDVKHKAFYPNFPEQVMNAHPWELYLNAFIHYYSLGTWIPEYEEETRIYELDHQNFKVLGKLTESDYSDIFTLLVSSRDSLNSEDMNIVQYFLDTQDTLVYPDEIPFKEILCLIGADRVNKDLPIDGLVKTSTDVLRIYTRLSDGDVSLAEDTIFTSLPRKHRRTLVGALEKVANPEDLLVHKNKWSRALHSLHVGDYSKKLYEMAKYIRDNKKFKTFYSKLEHAFETGNVTNQVKLLSSRPSVFARNLIRLFADGARGHVTQQIAFGKIIDKIPTKILLQTLGALRARKVEHDGFVVFPKGTSSKGLFVKKDRPKVQEEQSVILENMIRDSLKERFSKLGSLGKVFLSPELVGCPIPSQQRGSSTGTFQVAKGTRLPFKDDNNTLRLFIYWKGRDIDLSAVLYDKDFKNQEHISYSNLRHSYGCHSGDITYAPNGASEFIDINMPLAILSGYRYIAMTVFVYSGPSFGEHEICYAGWMTRDKPDSNEIYDPGTVVQKYNLTSSTRTSMPVIFDMKTREAIFVDSSVTMGTGRLGSNVENTSNLIKTMMKYMLESPDKVSLYELLSLHAEARGTIAENPGEADTVFSIEHGITPFDVNKIQSEFIV